MLGFTRSAASERQRRYMTKLRAAREAHAELQKANAALKDHVALLEAECASLRRETPQGDPIATAATELVRRGNLMMGKLPRERWGLYVLALQWGVAELSKREQARD